MSAASTATCPLARTTPATTVRLCALATRMLSPIAALVQRPAARRQPHAGRLQDQRDQGALGDHHRPLQVGGEDGGAGRQAAPWRPADQLVRLIDGVGGQRPVRDRGPLQIGHGDHLARLQTTVEHRHLDFLPQPARHGEPLRRLAGGRRAEHGGEALAGRLEAMRSTTSVAFPGMAPRADIPETSSVAPATFTRRSARAARIASSTRRLGQRPAGGARKPERGVRRRAPG